MSGPAHTPFLLSAAGPAFTPRFATFSHEEIEVIEGRVDLLFGPSLLREPGLRSLLASYERMAEPHALLDASLAFRYQNPAFRAFLRRFAYPVGSTLVRTFARSLNPQQPKEILEALASGTAGHSWTGLVLHRRREVTESMTKIHVRPYWTDASASSRPVAYTVFLDDVTLEHKRFLLDNLDSLLRASLQKDRDTASHVDRVNRYSRSLAEALYHDVQWPEVDLDFVENIGALAALHDIGKIGTPDDILNKEGPLNDFEWKVMKEHAHNGACILAAYPNPMAKEIALSHHEWWNGSGYPHRLEGPQIPLAARIVSLADVYDALRMKRSYKPSLSHDEAMAKISHGSGVQFDPALVDVVIQIQASFAQIYKAHQD
jgi:putative two-component system response regulator